jgi:hypothetical protein
MNQFFYCHVPTIFPHRLHFRPCSLPSRTGISTPSALPPFPETPTPRDCTSLPFLRSSFQYGLLHHLHRFGSPRVLHSFPHLIHRTIRNISVFGYQRLRRSVKSFLWDLGSCTGGGAPAGVFRPPPATGSYFSNSLIMRSL